MECFSLGSSTRGQGRNSGDDCGDRGDRGERGDRHQTSIVQSTLGPVRLGIERVEGAAKRMIGNCQAMPVVADCVGLPYLDVPHHAADERVQQRGRGDGGQQLHVPRHSSVLIDEWQNAPSDKSKENRPPIGTGPDRGRTRCGKMDTAKCPKNKNCRLWKDSITLFGRPGGEVGQARSGGGCLGYQGPTLQENRGVSLGIGLGLRLYFHGMQF